VDEWQELLDAEWKFFAEPQVGHYLLLLLFLNYNVLFPKLLVQMHRLVFQIAVPGFNDAVWFLRVGIFLGQDLVLVLETLE